MFNPFDIFNVFKFGNLSAVVKRYFTELASIGSQYYTIPSVTIDRIVMDVYSSAGSATGLPTGATAPTANKLDTLDFVYSGSISELGKNGASYFDGIIANVKMYNSGTLVRHYKINETWANDLVLNDVSGNAQHGTAVNITSADAELYTFNAQDNAWLANANLWSNPPSNIGAQWTDNGDDTYSLVGDGNLNELYNSGQTVSGVRYRAAFSITGFSGTGALKFRNSTANILELAADGAFTTDYVADGSNFSFARRNPGEIINATVGNVSCKRLIEVA